MLYKEKKRKYDPLLGEMAKLFLKGFVQDDISYGSAYTHHRVLENRFISAISEADWIPSRRSPSCQSHHLPLKQLYSFVINITKNPSFDTTLEGSVKVIYGLYRYPSLMHLTGFYSFQSQEMVARFSWLLYSEWENYVHLLPFSHLHIQFISKSSGLYLHNARYHHPRLPACTTPPP